MTVGCALLIGVLNCPNNKKTDVQTRSKSWPMGEGSCCKAANT